MCTYCFGWNHHGTLLWREFVQNMLACNAWCIVQLEHRTKIVSVNAIVLGAVSLSEATFPPDRIGSETKSIVVPGKDEVVSAYLASNYTYSSSDGGICTVADRK